MAWRTHRAVPARLSRIRARLDVHRERSSTARCGPAERDREQVHGERAAHGAAGHPRRRRHRGAARCAAVRAVQPFGRAAHDALGAARRSGRDVRTRASRHRRVAQHLDLSLPAVGPCAGDDLSPQGCQGPHLSRGRGAAAGLDLDVHDDHAGRRLDTARHELDLHGSVAAGRRDVQPADGPVGRGRLQHRERGDRHRRAGHAQVERCAHPPLVQSHGAPRREDPLHRHGRQGSQGSARLGDRERADLELHDDRLPVGRLHLAIGRGQERAALRRQHSVRDADGPGDARKQGPDLRLHGGGSGESHLHERAKRERRCRAQAGDQLHGRLPARCDRPVRAGHGWIPLLVHDGAGHAIRLARASRLQLGRALLVVGRTHPLLPDDEHAFGRVHAVPPHRGRGPASVA